MHRRTARGNRVGLASFGFVVLLAGAAILAAHYDWIPGGARQHPYPRTLQRFVADQREWLWPVAAAVAVIAGLFFLRWLLIQLRLDRIGRLTVDTDATTGSQRATSVPGETEGGDAGRTTMPASAATDAVESDIEQLRGVQRVHADLAGHPDQPELWLAVLTDADADLGRIRTTITRTVVPDARASLGHDDLPVYLRLVVGRRAATDRGLR